MSANDRTDHDALARRAAIALRDDVERRVDVDAALARVLAEEDPSGLVVQLPGGGRTARRPGRGWLGAAAAVALLATGAVVYAATRDGGSRVVPADSTDDVGTDAATTFDTTDQTTATAPDSSTSATTDPATTDPATSPAETPPATPTTTVALPPASEVDALAGLVAPTMLDPDAVPAFLPRVPVADPSQMSLTEFAQPADQDTATQLIQTWATDTGKLLEVTTRVGGFGLPPDAETLNIWPWDEAVAVTSMADGFTQVLLREPSGVVILWGAGFTADEVVAAFTTMVLGSDGWSVSDSTTTDLVSLHSGWRRTEFATRGARWESGSVRGELTVSLGMPDSIRTGFFGPGTPSTLADVNGAPALVTELPSGVGMSWSPTSDVVITLGYSGTVDDALELARSLEPVDDATWAAAGVVDTAPADGCDSYFFC